MPISEQLNFLILKVLTLEAMKLPNYELAHFLRLSSASRAKPWKWGCKCFTKTRIPGKTCHGPLSKARILPWQTEKRRRRFTEMAIMMHTLQILLRFYIVCCAPWWNFHFNRLLVFKNISLLIFTSIVEVCIVCYGTNVAKQESSFHKESATFETIGEA